MRYDDHDGPPRVEDGEAGAAIEPEDEGEVLLLKIDRLKQELRFCEEQVKASSSSEAAWMAKNEAYDASAVNVNNHKKQETETDDHPTDKTQQGSGVGAYATKSFEKKGGNITELTSPQSGGTDKTSLTNDSSSITFLSSSTTNVSKGGHTKDPKIYSTVAPYSAEDGGSKKAADKQGNDILTTTSIDEIVTPTAMRRGQQLREESLPGAVSVAGITSSSATHDRTSVRSGVGQIDEETDEQLTGSDGQGQNDMLLEADLVDELYGNKTGPLVTAKRDPWYRRNQWWIVGALVLLIVSIILAIVLTSIDLSPAPAPTMSPTTEFSNIETKTQALILSSFPSAAVSLANETSSQAEALRWVTEQRFNDLSLFTSTRILQQYALASFYFSTLGESTWSRKDGWLTTPNECDWYGVECEALGEANADEMIVARLSLPSNNISGRIPADVSILSTGLVALDLSKNKLTASIPPELNFLSLLTTLDLRANRLVGSIPTQISNLAKLESVDLSSNLLTSSIPSEIESLGMLRSLNIMENNLIGPIPSEVGALARLKYLNCESNRLAFAIPTEIGRLSRLESFLVGSNAFVSSLPSELGSLESLRTLDISNNLVSGTIPYHVSLISNMTSLDLSLNLLTGTVPNSFGILVGLTSLSLSDNGLTYLIPDSIASMQGLTHIDVSGNEFQEFQRSFDSIADRNRPTDVPWPELAKLTNLVYLDLSGMRFHLASYADEVLQLTNLEVLGVAGSNLGGGPFAPDNLLLSLTPLTTLREINLSTNFIFGKGLPTELGLLTNLEVLDFYGNRLIGELPTEIGLLTHLSILNLESSYFSGIMPTEITNLTNLTELNLAGESEIGQSSLGGSIPSTVGQLTMLRRLNLEFTDISGIIPSEIGLTQLEELHLTHTKIRGFIPTEIQSLTSLTSLSLRAADLSGSIPDFSVGFDKLKRLDLSATLLTGAVPSGIWSLTTLTLLDLSSINQISGFMPSAIARISNLITLNLAGVNMMESPLPSEIGLMSKLQVLDLSNTNLSGTVPSEVFQCTQLSSLFISGTYYTGSLPTELGLATNLLALQISDATITGSIPTEIGSLRLLETLDFSNTEVGGSIPSELTGRLLLLKDLKLGATQLSGSIPAHMSRLLSLRTLSLFNTSITGEIPSEIAVLTELRTFDIAEVSIVGTVPSEMATMEHILLIDLRGTRITGNIPDILCEVYESQSGGGISQEKRTVAVDCGEVSCNCCDCDERFASTSPSLMPSTAAPSTSISPTASPSASSSPSESTIPTAGKACRPFATIADIGTEIFGLWADEGFENVTLPFPFYWRGQSVYSVVSVSPNGVVVLGDINSCDTCGYYQDCCEAFPAGEFSGFGLPRIVLGQADLDFYRCHPLVSANAYYATVDDTFIISYEGATFHPANQNELNLYFQVVFYPTGDIEMRWGEGFPQEGTSVSVGLEDFDIAIAATGEPFDERGVTAPGTWPAHQCRTFTTTSDGNYTEYDAPTVAPSTSSVPSTSAVPTMDSACFPFSPIGDIGIPVFTNDACGYDKQTVSLPFAFKWRGQEAELEFSSITVSPNGAVFLGDFNECPMNLCPYDLVTCCSAFPIGDLSRSRIPRIAVAQHNLEGNVYYATVGETFVISFEGGDFVPVDASGDLNLYFQVALYADGRVEMRWGQGFPRLHETMVAGLEGFHLAVPATGGPFGPGGVTGVGKWPTDQCRLFVPTVDGNYTEYF